MLLFEDDPESEFIPVATNLARLRRDMRACGATPEEIKRIESYLPHIRPKLDPQPNKKRGNGRAYNFLLALVVHQGDECVTFPFSRNDEGYGCMSYDRKRYKAHRLMCELRHGPAPTAEHTAAHSCGKGHEGCVNPNHLDWKTQSENVADRKTHGTQVSSRWGYKGRLTEQQVQYVRDMRGLKSHRALARELGVSNSCVTGLLTGKTWLPNPKIRAWLPEEDDAIRAGALEIPGRTIGAIRLRLKRLARQL